MTQTVLRRRQRITPQQSAIATVEIDQTRIDTSPVEFYTPGFRQGLNAAIGNDECHAVRHQQQFMRTDAMRRIFGKYAKILCGTCSHQALTGVDIVFGDEDGIAVRATARMAKEMPVVARFPLLQDTSFREIDLDCLSARPACNDQCFMRLARVDQQAVSAYRH